MRSPGRLPSGTRECRHAQRPGRARITRRSTHSVAHDRLTGPNRHRTPRHKPGRAQFPSHRIDQVLLPSASTATRTASHPSINERNPSGHSRKSRSCGSVTSFGNRSQRKCPTAQPSTHPLRLSRKCVGEGCGFQSSQSASTRVPTPALRAPTRPVHQRYHTPEQPPERSSGLIPRGSVAKWGVDRPDHLAK